MFARYPFGNACSQEPAARRAPAARQHVPRPLTAARLRRVERRVPGQDRLLQPLQLG
jgi:hypothetical protein